MTDIQNIPLSNLVLSDLNVRKARSKEDIAAMAASIEAEGILQNLLAHPTEGETFAVVIGGTSTAAQWF